MANDLEQQLVDVTRRFAGGDVEGALASMAELERRCTTDAEHAEVMARYATFFHLLDLRDEGLAAIARALALDPCNPRAHYLNALQLMIDERWDEAITELNKAARYYHPDDGEHLAEVYGNLSYCWEQLGDTARADMYDEICADLDPEGIVVDDDPRSGVWTEGFEVPVEGGGEEESEPGLGDAGTEAVPDLVLTGSEWIAEMVRDLTPRARRRVCRPRRGRGKGHRGLVQLRDDAPEGEVEAEQETSNRQAGARPSSTRRTRRRQSRPRRRRP